MIDQLYQDFTNKVLPKVAEGFSITKDYFFDLFGRYVKYLIVTDGAWLGFWFVFTLVFIVFATILWKKANKASSSDAEAYVFFFIISVIAIVVGFIGIACKGNDLAKDFYIPEIRVYQELKPFMAK